MTPVTEYIKNLGKSVKYTAVEYLGYNMPATKEFMESNEELFKDTYHAIANIRRTKNRFETAIKKTAVYDIADTAFTNAVDSFKTGRFNDPYRQSKADTAAFGLDDFESGDMDMSMDNLSDSTSTGGSMDENTKAVLDSSANNAATVANAQFESAKYIAGVSKANTGLLFKQTLQMNQTLSAGFSGLNAGMDALNRFNTEVVQTLADNATKYFQNTTDILKENNAMFKEFLEMQRNLYKKEDTNTGKSHDLEDVMGINGSPNIKAYIKMITKNVKDELGQAVPGLDSMLENPEMIKSMLANPLSAIPGLMMSVAMGPMLKSSLKQFDNTISSIFGGFLAKMSFNANDENAPWYKQLMGKILGVKYLGKSSIDTRNTKNGPTPFDHQTKRAITEVIPGYLARIESGITGQPAKLYNDRTGKWTNIATVKKNFEQQQEGAKLSGSSSLHAEMNKNMNDAKWDQKAIDAMTKVMEKIAKKRYSDNGHLEFFNGDLDKFADYYGLDENAARLYLALYGSTSRSARAQSASKILQAKLNQRKSLKYEESLGSGSVYRQLFTEGFDDNPITRAKIFDRDSKGNIIRDQLGNAQMKNNSAENVGGVFNLNNMSDKYGSTVFDYLRSIDINTSRITGSTPTGGSNHGPIHTTSDIIPNSLGSDNNSSNIIIGGSSTNAGGSPIILGPTGNIISGGQSSSDKSSTTNADKEEKEKKEKEVKMSDFKESSIMDMSHDITRVGAANQLKDLKRRYEEENPNLANHIAELIDMVDELRDAAKNGERLPGQDEYKSEQGKKFLEATKELRKYMDYPGAALAGGVQAFNDSIYNFLYGTPEDFFKDSHEKMTELISEGDQREKPKGFFQAMYYGMNNMFDRIKDNLDMLDEEKQKSIWNKADAIIDGMLGFKMSDVLKSTKNAIVNNVGGAFKDVANDLGANKDSEKKEESSESSEEPPPESETETPSSEESKKKKKKRRRRKKGKAGHAEGVSTVTKSGMTFLSKGEIVIPNASEDQRELDAINEEKLRQKFINQAKHAQMFSEGGEAVDVDIDDWKAKGQSFMKGARNIASNIAAKFTDEANEAKAADSIYGRMKDILFGDSFKETQDTVKKVESEIKEKIPNVASGGILGTAAGSLIGGPLVGAVLGSALGIATNSETVQTALFGEKVMKDGKETGERNGSGLFSTEAQKTMKKYLPDMKKYGIVAGTIGMFTPFGLLGGALMGSAIGFMKNNESVQETLFGKDGLFDEDTQKTIKKYFPSAAKGGAGGLLLGLAGGLGGAPLLGVAALGAGIGLVTTTDEFKDEVLGKLGKDGKRHGGVLEEFKKETIGPFKKFGSDMTAGFKKWFKEDIADPVVKSIKPMGKEVGLLTKQGFKLAKEGIAKLLNSKTGIPLLDSIMNSKAVQKAKGAAGFLGGKAKNGTAWLLSRPSAMVGKLGDKLRASHIENGTADYMTAAERLEWMAANGKTDYAHKKFDEQLAGSSSAQLKQMQELFGTLQNGVGYYDDNIKNTRKGLGKAVSQTLGKGNGAVATEIMKLVNKGDLKGAQEVLDSSNITIAKKKSLAKIINDSGTALQEYEAKKKNYDDNREAKYEKLKKLGFTNISDDNLDNYQKLFSAEAKSRLKTEEAEKEMGEEDSIANQITSSLDVNFDAAIAEMQKTNELLSGILSGGTMNPADMKRIRKSNIAGRKAALKNDKAMNKLIRKRSNDISKKFGGAKLNDSTKNKIADNDKLYQNMRDFSKTRAGKLVDPNYVAGIKNEKLQDLYFSLAQKGYTIDNIDVLEKFDDDQIANLERLTEANMRIESLKDISKLDKKTTGYLVEMLKYPEMKKLTQKQLITIAKKSGARFVNDPIMRDKMLRAAKKHGKDFTGKIDEDNLKLGPIPKKKKKKASSKKSSTKEEAAPKEETPEIQSHAFGGLALLDGLSTVSKGETILNLGKSAVKHAGNWAKNKAKERLMNSSAGKAYQSATNLKAKVSGNAPKSAPSGTTTKDTEYGALTYTKGANGKQVLANTKENVMVQKAMAKKDAVQQDISDTMHKLLEVNQQIADNTTPPGADKKGGGLLGTILGLLGTFLFNKFKKAWKFLKDGFGIVSKGVKGLAVAVGSIGSIATKIGEATAKAGELVKTLSKPMKSISKAFGKTSGLFKKLAKIGNAVKGKKGLAAIAAAGVAAYEIGFSDDDDGEDKKEGESKPGETPDDGGKEPTPTPGPGEPPPGQPPEKPANMSLGGAAAGAATGAMALYGANRLSNTSFFRNDPKSTGMMSKLGKAFGAYSAYDTVSSAYDFATASTDDKLKMLNKWNDKSLLDKGLDVMGYATGIGFMKDMGGKALSMIRNGGQAAEAAGEAAGAANKFEWAKDITDKGKDLVEKGKGAIGKTAEQAAPIIEKVKTAFNTVTEKISKFVSEKYSKGIIKLKDFIIKKLTNPAVIKKVLKEAGKLVGKAALAATGVGAIAVGALMAADVVSAFYQGFNNPIEILSLAQGCSPSLDMKMLSGVISAFWAGVPVCPIIFDDPKEFADVCIENIGPVVGITRASLDEESKKSEEEGSEMGGVFNDIKNGISNNIEYVKNGISNNIEYVKNGISNNIEYVKNGISNNAEYVKNGIINNAEWVKNKASEKWEAAKEFVGDKATKVGEAVDELGGKAKETINDGIDIAYQFYNGISTKANEVMDGLMAGIAKSATGIAKFVGDGFASIGKGISNSVNSVLSNIGKVGSSVIKSISNSAVGRAASTAYNTVKNFASGVYDKAKNFASGAYDTVKNFASGAYDKAKSVASSVGSAASSAWDTAKSYGSKALDAFKGSSVGRVISGSGKWGRGDIKPSDIDSISSYEDCMELLGGVDINSIPAYNRPSSEDSITVLKAKAKAIISSRNKKTAGTTAASKSSNINPINALKAKAKAIIPSYGEKTAGTTAASKSSNIDSISSYEDCMKILGSTDINSIPAYNRPSSEDSITVLRAKAKAITSNNKKTTGATVDTKSTVDSKPTGDAKSPDIDSISSYEDCMKAIEGIDINSIPEYNRPSSDDSITVLKAKAKAIISANSKKTGTGKWGRGAVSDANNSFHSQLDPINAMNFNASGDTVSQSMRDSGCGPVSAANIGAYFGKQIDSKDAASFALRKGYKEKNGGTKDGFFGDYLGQYGINTKHISTGNAKESLKNGKPVLLMGQDDSNSPILDASGRGKTPFGTNPHYVVATGLDKRGNMIIQDPESRTPNRVFKANDVLNKSSIAMDASNTGKGRWGRGGDIKPSDVDKISSYEDCMELLGGVDINSIPAYNRPSSEDSINVLKAKAKAIISSYGKGKWGTGPAVDEKPPFGSIAASIAQKVGSQHPELFWAQMMYETGGPDRVKKDIAKMGFDDFNYGGFTWYPGMGENYKGAPRPSSEGGYYAKFSSDAEYADMAYRKVYQSYADELKNAATPEDFAHILKKHGYYAADESDYAAGLKSILNGQYKGDLGNLGGMAASGGPGGPGKKYGGLFGAFDRITDTLSAILNGSDDSGGSSGNSSGPAGGLANGGVPGDTGLDYMLKNLPGAVVTSSYKDASGRPTPGEHGGIDIAADENTPVPTPVNGVVEDAGSDSGYGNYVQVKDKNGNFHLFGHLNEQKVSTGDNVNKGTIIGLEGSTGHSTGPHVHYQIDPPSNVAAVKSGPHLDPATYSISGLGKFGLGHMKAKYGGAKWGMGEGAHIWEYLKNRGLGSSAIAGIMGNMQAESSLEPNIVQGGGHADEITVDGSTGYGLCQWTSQDRQQGLKNFAASRGTKSSDTDTQLEYMLKEISDGYGDLLSKMDGMSPYDAALLFHKEFERSADTSEMAARRGQFAEEIAKSEGKGETFNGTYSGSPSSGGPAKKYSGLFGAFERIADALSDMVTGENSSGGPGAANNGGVAGGHSSDAGIQAASQWANSMTGQTGYGDNGCTEFVKNYLLKANNPVGQLMKDGSQGNLMYVPTLEDWAKKNNMFKDASQGGAEGDIAITNDHGHVTIADGDGGAWGNSSSQNKIIHYKSIADAFGTPNGYVSTGSGKAAVSQGESKRSAAEMAADGGSSNGWGGSKWGTGNWLDILNSLSNASINNNISSMTNIPRGIGLFGNSDTSDGVPKGNAPKEILGHPYISDGVPKDKDTSNNPFKRINDSWNSLKKSGEAIAAIWNPRLRKKLNEKLDSAKPKIPKVEFKKISEDDINNIKNAEGAIALLKEASIPIDKIPDMNMPKDTDDLGVIRQKVRTIIKTIKPEAPAEKAKELVDGKYEKNDVDYLLNRGYTKEDAIALLAKDPKYNNGLVDGKYEKNDVDYLLNHGYTKEDAIALLAKDPKYNKKNAADIEKKTKETSFDLDTVKKKFQDRVKQLFHPESAKDSTNSKTSTTSSTQQTSTKTSVPTQTSAQQKAQEAQTATATTNVIDYTEKFDTIISLLNIIAGNPLNTSAQTNSGNNTSVHMVNAKNTGNIRADELAKMFTNINNAMNNLASR